MKNIFTITILAIMLTACAQQKTAESIEGSTTVSAAYLAQAKYVEQQIVSLAGAFPQELYSWRPMEGVRSVAEAFLHIAAVNYLIVTTIGGTIPAEMDPTTLETSTIDKTKIQEELKKSFEVVNTFLTNLPSKDYNRHVDYFGTDMTVLDMIFLAATHQHEHLGQEIAYARMNKIVPPWSAVK